MGRAPWSFLRHIFAGFNRHHSEPAKAFVSFRRMLAFNGGSEDVVRCLNPFWKNLVAVV